MNIPFYDAVGPLKEMYAGFRKCELRIPYCSKCKSFTFPPTPFCPTCPTQKLSWVKVSGFGIVCSTTTIRGTTVPAFQHLVPYTVLVVELLECTQVRLFGRLSSSSDQEVTIGDTVEVVFEELHGVTLACWKLTPPQ